MERPILFSAPMVRALLDGRKTQTRRIVDRLPRFGRVTEFKISGTPGYDLTFRCKRRLWQDFRRADFLKLCPYGNPGDRLWVRESCYIWGRWAKNGLTKSGKQRWQFKIETPNTVVFDSSHPQVATKRTQRETAMYWRRPSIHMPRWASRINLEITEVRVQRLQDISEGDAVAEGCEMDGIFPKEQPHLKGGMVGWDDAIEWYAYLWDEINGDGAWDVNPWVWAVSFKGVQA